MAATETTKKRNQQLMRIAIALVCGALAMLATSVIYSHRDELVEWSWASPHGKFDPGPDEPRAKTARDFAESRNPGLACVEKWLGKDDKYLYLALGCAQFEEVLGEVKVKHGDPNFLATRMRYAGDAILEMEQPRLRTYKNGLRRLFPFEAAEKLRNTASLPDFHREGLTRMAQIRGK